MLRGIFLQGKMNKEKCARVSKKNAASAVICQTLLPITLPSPKLHRGTTVFEALKKRRTVRAIGDRKLPLQVLSNLLWAACGVNAKKGPFGIPGRTAASASNSQEIDLYVAMPEGIYLYEPLSHKLIPAAAGDLRTLAIGPGQGKAGAKAPVRLVYVVDIDKFSKAGFQEPGLYDREIRKSYYYVDTGIMAENVYLFAASQGLATWFHNCNRTALAKILKLRPNQRVLFGQTVGYPEKNH
jgi:SagB-type dehydrogenase family enzyme